MGLRLLPGVVQGGQLLACSRTFIKVVHLNCDNDTFIQWHDYERFGIVSLVLASECPRPWSEITLEKIQGSQRHLPREAACGDA